MTEGERYSLRRHASEASQIGALCHYLSTALSSEPRTSLPAQAIDGLMALVDRLSDDLNSLADPDE
jgi:hypothetical protein